MVQVEREIKYAELLIKRQPRLKFFIRQSKCIVMCTITALLKLVSHEESAESTSLANKEFGIELEKDNTAKSLYMYKEHHFTKLGYTARAIVECLPQFRNVLNNSTHANMLTEACSLYIESKYIYNHSS